jgi:hypothetical protein
MQRITPSDLRQQAQVMICDQSMPTLETLLEAIEETRKKYSEQLKLANCKKSQLVSKPKAS